MTWPRTPDERIRAASGRHQPLALRKPRTKPFNKPFPLPEPEPERDPMPTLPRRGDSVNRLPNVSRNPEEK